MLRGRQPLQLKGTLEAPAKSATGRPRKTLRVGRRFDARLRFVEQPLLSAGRCRVVKNKHPPEHPKHLGSRAELAVAEYLAERGFELVALNLRVGHDELDVVARKLDLVIVVEVRSRGVNAWTSAFGSIMGPKRRHVRRAAQRLWRQRYARDASVSRLRIDAATVQFDSRGVPLITYCPAAFC